MSGPVTGIALLATAGPTTSRAAPAASSAMPPRLTPAAPASTASFHVVAAAAGAARDGNPVTGYAPDRDAMSTTLRAEWSASGAMHQGNSVANLHFDQSRFSIFGYIYLY
ncbi:hypothetical protein PHJA_001462900 [Phtheirospermum japonicum]|uniref:Uncharacterized protein n=1 Tax=Phtheirospermum japonicum TaxID=374723 RepID=A0A830C251_9LAMI|nr:hypothetical protein PHJA_001462900 [Phtheirospermum japonicum]